jgi:hypothetical protein
MDPSLRRDDGFRTISLKTVIPAQAGIHRCEQQAFSNTLGPRTWIPACAGTTFLELSASKPSSRRRPGSIVVTNKHFQTP